MKKAKLLLSLFILAALVMTQAATVFAAPGLEQTEPITGTITEVTLETDPNSGVTTVLISIEDDMGEVQKVRVSEETAYDLGLLDYDADGNPFIVEPLPETIEIDPDDILPDAEEKQHPVGTALAAYFSTLPGVEYDVIMGAHEDGHGFGVIAQALWLTRKLDGDSQTLLDILYAKESGDYSGFTFENGSDPTSWGQFRKAVMDGDKKGNLGAVMSEKDKEKGHDNGAVPGNNPQNEDNKDKDNGKNKDKQKDPKDNGNPNKP